MVASWGRLLNIVVVSTEPPDPFGNAAGRWYYVLAKGLSERGHAVRWLSAYTREDSAGNARSCLQHTGVNLTLYPYPARSGLKNKWQTVRRPYSYFISKGLVQDLRAALDRGYDVLHLEQTWAGWLGIGVPRTVLSVHWLACVDLLAGKSRTIGSFTTDGLMKRAERHIISNCQTIRGMSLRDCEIIGRINPQARVVAIPLAIDHHLYPFSTREPEVPTIGVVGNMNWGPTRAATERLLTAIWPLVKERVPGLRLLIVGWGARTAFAEYLSEPQVRIIEDVPEADRYFHELSLLAFPLSLGSGTKVKVLEAMAYGVPVVTTEEGIQGIPAEPGVHVAVGNDDGALADLIVELIGDREARESMRVAARRLIEEQHSPEPVLNQFVNLLETVTAKAVS